MGSNSFSEVFNRLDREIWLITARANNRHSGLIATYVSRASLVPAIPRITVGLAKHHFTHELIQSSDAFCMHLIDEDHIDWVWRFGISSGREIDKLRGLAIQESVTGSPILADAVAGLDCRVEAQLDTGDRTLFVAEVLNVRVISTAPPLTFNRLIELAPADKLLEMNLGVERDIELDRNAILKWRRQQTLTGNAPAG
ncbi:MAG TPA: flavin reductase family protein [Lacipirellulaceae bacterium]|nr:flavin reductase family protein [Lacipirellulaceae bacterium]